MYSTWIKINLDFTEEYKGVGRYAETSGAKMNS